MRVPSWSAGTTLRVNGGEEERVEPGKYAVIERAWKKGDWLRLTLDMGHWWWVGERECKGMASAYWGPVLLAYDPRLDAHDPRKLPRIDPRRGLLQQMVPGREALIHRRAAANGSTVTLCDFASAGAAGNPYVSWLPVEGLPEPAAVSRDNPWRMLRP